jgi:hypothetical protein
MEELATGREWVRTVWYHPHRFRAERNCSEQAKISLERAINVVSNWGEYGLGRLQIEEEVSEAEHRLYEEEKINLVCRE